MRKFFGLNRYWQIILIFFIGQEIFIIEFLLLSGPEGGSDAELRVKSF